MDVSVNVSIALMGAQHLAWVLIEHAKVCSPGISILQWGCLSIYLSTEPKTRTPLWMYDDQIRCIATQLLC